MNLRKQIDIDLLDLSLKHTLKNWVNQSSPPENGKMRLLNAAMQSSQKSSKSRLSELFGWISSTLNDNHVELYFESYRNNQFNLFQMASFDFAYNQGLMTR